MRIFISDNFQIDKFHFKSICVKKIVLYKSCLYVQLNFFIYL